MLSQDQMRFVVLAAALLPHGAGPKLFFRFVFNRLADLPPPLTDRTIPIFVVLARCQHRQERAPAAASAAATEDEPFCANLLAR
jgi:hypothetical protein